MRSIKHKILVLSGKGGVGKSTFSAQLAFALASHGRQVCAHLHMHHQPQTALLAIAFVQCLRAHQPVQVSAKGTAAAVNVITAAFSTADHGGAHLAALIPAVALVTDHSSWSGTPRGSTALCFTARALLSCCLLFTGLPPSVAGWIVSRQLQQSCIQKVLPAAAYPAVA